MSLKEKLTNASDYYLDHPYRFAPVTFLMVDRIFHNFHGIGLLDRPEFTVDIFDRYYDAISSSIKNDTLGLFWDVAKPQLFRDSMQAIYFPVVLYLSTKINKLAGLFHSENFKPMVKQAIMYESYRFGHKDKQRLKLELHDLIDIQPSKSRLNSLASIYEQEGDMETALDFYKKAIDLKAYHADEFLYNIFSKNNPINYFRDKFGEWTSGFDVNINKIRKNPKDINYHLSRIAHLFHREKLKKFKRAVRISTEVNNDSKESRFVYALMSEYLKDTELAQDMWSQGLSLLMKDDINFRKMAKSRNEVLEFKGSEFFRKLFVFKRGSDLGHLATDFVVNGILYDKLTKLGMHDKVSEPLLFFENKKDGKYYSITRREEKLNLEDLLDNESDINPYIEETVRNLGLIHAFGLLNLSNDYVMERDGVKANIPVYDYIDELDRRLIKRMGRNNLSDKFLYSYKSYMDRMKLNTFNFLCHGDLYPPNVLENGMIIDFERANVGNPSLDLANLLESTGDKSEDEIQKLTETYHESLTSRFGRNNIMINDILRNYFYLDRFHSLMCDIGSKMNQGKFHSARTDTLKVEKSLKSVNARLRDSFVDYIHIAQPSLLA